jgi:hypothetical protein
VRPGITSLLTPAQPLAATAEMQTSRKFVQ